MGRMKQIGPGVSVYTEEPEGAEERASREAQEARWRRAREIGAAMRAGPFPMTLTQWARSAGVRRDEDYRDNTPDGPPVEHLADYLARRDGANGGRG